MPKNNLNEILDSIYVCVSVNKGKPILLLRKVVTDTENIKTVISSVFHSQPIILLPNFKDKLLAINNLIEKGIAYRNKKDGQLYFNF